MFIERDTLHLTPDDIGDGVKGAAMLADDAAKDFFFDAPFQVRTNSIDTLEGHVYVYEFPGKPLTDSLAKCIAVGRGFEQSLPQPDASRSSAGSTTPGRRHLWLVPHPDL